MELALGEKTIVPLKRCSESLVIREMQIETIIRYLLEGLKFKKYHTKHWQGHGRIHCWWERKIV